MSFLCVTKYHPLIKCPLMKKYLITIADALDPNQYLNEDICADVLTGSNGYRERGTTSTSEPKSDQEDAFDVNFELDLNNEGRDFAMAYKYMIAN